MEMQAIISPIIWRIVGFSFQIMLAVTVTRSKLALLETGKNTIPGRITIAFSEHIPPAIKEKPIIVPKIASTFLNLFFVIENTAIELRSANM